MLLLTVQFLSYKLITFHSQSFDSQSWIRVGKMICVKSTFHVYQMFIITRVKFSENSITELSDIVINRQFLKVIIQ